MTKLSATQHAVIERMLETGQPLERWRGGFWTIKGCPYTLRRDAVGDMYRSPDWHVGTNTVKAMERAGLLKRANVHGEEWRDERILIKENLP